ncbi:MAG: hypothetical protein M0D53_08170 [Flavobacterium sp. JAD_PAG50586_2]|nr:MAG: hypothetical protein M0D53_08170 [Flavobacterium sp. JAD_PAG50586_2]
MKLILLLQQANIDEKIKNAPNDGYMIGVWIGYVLPFALLIGVAYLIITVPKKDKTTYNIYLVNLQCKNFFNE